MAKRKKKKSGGTAAQKAAAAKARAAKKAKTEAAAAPAATTAKRGRKKAGGVKGMTKAERLENLKKARAKRAANLKAGRKGGANPGHVMTAEARELRLARKVKRDANRVIRALAPKKPRAKKSWTPGLYAACEKIKG